MSAVHRHVQAEGLLALVHRRGHGRDGIHRSREQHERSGRRISAISGTTIVPGYKSRVYEQTLGDKKGKFWFIIWSR